MRWIFLLVPGGFGLLLVWGGVFGVMQQRALQRRGVHAKGIVVDVVRSRSRVVTYHPVVEFTGSDGKSHRFENSYSSATHESDVEKGKPVDVLYVADDPSNAVIGRSAGSISGSVAAAVLGLIVLALLMFFSNPQRGMSVVGSLRWVAVALIAGTGLAFFVSGSIWGARRYLLLHSGARAEGAVLNYLPAARGSGSMAVIGFKAGDAQQHQFAASTFAKYKDGARLEVIYKPHDPSVAVVNDFQQFWLGPLATTLFGLFFVFLGWLAYVFLKDAASDELSKVISERL